MTFSPLPGICFPKSLLFLLLLATSQSFLAFADYSSNVILEDVTPAPIPLVTPRSSESHRTTKPPTLSTLIDSISNYLSDTLFSVFAELTSNPINGTNSTFDQHKSGPPASYGLRNVSPIVWLRLLASRLKDHLFPPADDQSIMSRTTNAAALAVGEILDKLVDTHNVFLLASIRNRPWYIRIPMYLFHRYGVSYSFYFSRRNANQSSLVDNNIILEKTRAQLLAVLKQAGEEHILASGIVDALDATLAKSSTVSDHVPGSGIVNPKRKSDNPSEILVHNLTSVSPSAHAPMAIATSFASWLQQSILKLCVLTWRECWRMHMETMYTDSTPTALGCTTLYAKSAAVAIARNTLYAIHTIVYVIQTVTDTVSKVLDQVLTLLASDSLTIPLSSDDMSYVFLSQLISLFRMALLLALQIIRVAWTLCFHKRSFMLAVAVLLFYRHWWHILWFAYSLSRRSDNANMRRNNLWENGHEQFRSFQNEERKAATRMRTTKKQKPFDKEPRGHQRLERVSSKRGIFDQDTGKDRDGTFRDDEELSTQASLEETDGSLSYDSKDEVEAMPLKGKRLWEPHSTIAPSRLRKQNAERGYRTRVVRRVMHSKMKNGGEGAMSNESSEKYVVQREEKRKGNQSAAPSRHRSRPMSGIHVNPSSPTRTVREKELTPNATMNMAKTGLDFAMRLLDINTQTAQHAREAMALARMDSNAAGQIHSKENRRNVATRLNPEDSSRK